ncbi:MAG: flagellar hook-associated protein FlgK [Fibrobacterota bacterium]
MGISSSLNTGNRALHAAQLGLNVTGQNISNANVEGYSRKRLSQAADYRQDGAFGQIGMGVDVLSIERMRNAHIDAQIQKQLEHRGTNAAIDEALNTAEGVLKEPNDVGLQHYIESFFDSWENLANNPEDQAARTMLLTQSETLTSVFKNADDELRDLQNAQNEQIGQEVGDVNKILREIDDLNKEVTSVELVDQNANDSRDRRDQLLKELSEKIDVDVREDRSGAISITSGGNILVSPSTVNELEVYEKSGDRQGDMARYSIRIKGSRQDMNVRAGKIKGLMETRDNYIPKYREDIDTLAVSLTEVINEQHSTGYNLNGYTGFDFFDPTVTGARDFSVSQTIASDTDNIAAARGGAVDGAATNTFDAADLNTGSDWVDLTKDNGTEQASNIVNGSVVVKAMTGGGDEIVLEEGTDYAVNYLNGTIRMMNNGYDGNDKTVDFDYMSGNFPGPGNNENAIKIAELRDSMTMSSKDGKKNNMSFSDFYGSTIGELGIDRKEAGSNLETRDRLVQEYQERQDSVAGVSLDEEMSNLIKYQNSYQAAARIITTVRQMLDVLMNI